MPDRDPFLNNHSQDVPGGKTSRVPNQAEGIEVLQDAPDSQQIDGRLKKAQYPGGFFATAHDEQNAQRV
jgi:hypothetical protein